MRRWLAGPLLALVVAAPAQAAYNPQVQLTVPTDGGPGSPAAVTATIMQAAGEEPTASVDTRIPLAFGTNPSFAAHGCTPTEQASGCPDSSKIGSVSAMTVLGPASGPLYFLQGFKLMAPVSSQLLPLVTFDIEGQITISATDIDVAFTGLPAIQSTQMQLVFEGGDRSPLALPTTCGTQAITVSLTSQSGAVVTGDHPVTISGCGAALDVRKPAVSAKTVAAGSSTTVSWALAGAPARTRVTLVRLGAHPRSLGSTSVKASAGRNHLRVGPAWRGKRLQPGRYRVGLVALDAAGGQSPTRQVSFRVTA